jgi:hypothetical protein
MSSLETEAVWVSDTLLQCVLLEPSGTHNKAKSVAEHDQHEENATIIIIIIIIIMQGIYTYIPETNRDSKVHTVATIVYLLFKVHIEY